MTSRFPSWPRRPAARRPGFAWARLLASVCLLALAAAGCGESEAGQARLDGSTTGRGVGPVLAPPAGKDGRASWTEIHTGGTAGRDSPTAGEDVDAAYDARRNRLYVYGGKGDDNLNVAELWVFDLATGAWSRIVTEGPMPPPREDHTLVLDEANDALVLFGGEDGPTSNATWVFHLARPGWEEITHESAPPLENHIAMYDPRGRRMVVWGGLAGPKMDDLTWALDLDPGSKGYRTWSEVPTSTPRPSARREHSGTYDPVRHRLLILGGRDRTKDGFLDDLWSLSLADGRWEQLTTTGERPDKVRQAIVGYDAARNHLTLFGGEALAIVDDEPDEFLTDRVWVLDMETLVWKDKTPYPRAVYDHVGVFIPELGATWIFGGSADRPQKVREIWLLRDG